MNTPAMSPAAERRLYDTDYPAWLQYSAPRMARRLMDGSITDLDLCWSLLTRPVQLAVWPFLDAAHQQRLRAVRAHSTATTEATP